MLLDTSSVDSAAPSFGRQMLLTLLVLVYDSYDRCCFISAKMVTEISSTETRVFNKFNYIKINMVLKIL